MDLAEYRELKILERNRRSMNIRSQRLRDFVLSSANVTVKELIPNKQIVNASDSESSCLDMEFDQFHAGRNLKTETIHGLHQFRDDMVLVMRRLEPDSKEADSAILYEPDYGADEI